MLGVVQFAYATDGDAKRDLYLEWRRHQRVRGRDHNAGTHVLGAGDTATTVVGNAVATASGAYWHRPGRHGR